MLALFYDVELAFMPLTRERSNDPRQPHLVQIAACLVDLAGGKKLATLDLIVRPEEWMIPEDLSRVHGITTERAQTVGVSEALAVELLLELNARCEVRIAHSEHLDQRAVRIACKRFFDESTAEEWKATPTKCTAALTTPLLQLPPTEKMIKAGFNRFKTPNLGEAYRALCGNDLTNTYRALANVQACFEIFFALQRSGHPEAAPA